MALFTDADADWHGLSVFYDEIFLPYMIGGLICGAIAGTVCYYLSVPVIRVYKKRRQVKIKAKFNAIRKKAAAEADANGNAD